MMSPDLSNFGDGAGLRFKYAFTISVLRIASPTKRVDRRNNLEKDRVLRQT